MAIFKCKMCGGTLNFTEGSTVAECECCGTKQTLPKLSDEKRANLYDRANHFRRNNDYDKALSIYEQILNEDKTDAEAYWSIVLCKYGIEYVEDPSTHKRIPTVNRTQFTSIFADEDYKAAIANADGYQRDLYEAEAKEIDKIQKGILAISGKESPYDVFICYKETDNGGRRTQDSVLAQDLYFGLKNEGFNVFFSRITLEDKLGSAYEPHIFAAIHSAKVMVVLGTKAEHFNAVWVKNEWSRYLALIKKGENKTLIPAYKDMDPYDLPDEFSHLQAQDMSKLGFMQDLLRGIKKIVEADREKSGQVKEAVVVSGKQDITPLLKRAFLFLEDGDFTNADEYVEKVLDINPECAEAYIVKLLIDLRLRKPEQLTTCPSPIASNSNFNKAIRFASPEYRNVLQGYKNANIEHIAKAKEQARKEAIYEQALDRLSVAPDDIAYKKSIAELESIIDYKDAKEQIERIKTLLDAWYVTQEKERVYREEQAEKAKIYAEEQRLEKQRKLEQQKIVEQRAKATKKKAMAIGIPSALVLFAIIVVTIVLLIPPSNIPYTVNHYLQNLENEEYTLETSEELKGTANKTVTPAVKSFDGFTAPETQQVRILEDGSLVVDYYYTRNSYTVTLTTNGGEEMQTIPQKYQSTFSLATPERTGYTFGGWFSDINLSQAIPETIPAKDITIYAWWTEENKPSDFEYTGTETLSITRYVGNATSVTIPAYIGDIPVASLASHSFYGTTYSQNIENIIFADTIESISYQAFLNCSNLVSIQFGDGIKKIGSEAFAGCSSLKRINSDVDYEAIFPEGLEIIEGFAFRGLSSIKTIIIPDSIQSIGSGVFKDCSSLKEITIPFIGHSVNSLQETGVLGFIFGYESDMNNYTYYKTSTHDTTYQFSKDQTNFALVTYYYRYYIPKSLRKVTITKQTTIPSNAFMNCDLIEEVVLPDGVISIGGKAFYNCSNLQTMNISNITSIGDSAFDGCGLLENQTGVVYIGKVLYKYVGTMPSGYILNIKEGTTSIQNGVFINCTGLAEVIIPNSLVKIGATTFKNCSSLTKLSIPNSVEYIGYNAFVGCSSLLEVTLPFIGCYIGEELNQSLTLTIPNTIEKITITGDVSQIIDETFKGFNKLKEIVLPTTVKKIGESAFNGCSSLQKISLPTGITEIADYCFKGCSSLESITLPANTTKIGLNAFQGCNKLSEIIIPQKVENIGSYAFDGCSSLVVVTITNGALSNVGSYAFQNCTLLTEIYIPATVTFIGEYAFNGCSTLAIKYAGVAIPSTWDYNWNANGGTVEFV